MPRFLKDDLTVALDDVDRVATRIITIYRDLGAIAQDREAAARLMEEADRREAALERFNQARRAHDQIPEVGDPELAHFQALWLKLKSTLAATDALDALEASLAELDQALWQAIEDARALGPAPDIEAALTPLMVGRSPPSP